MLLLSPLSSLCLAVGNAVQVLSQWTVPGKTGCVEYHRFTTYDVQV
jgi:hypothetical protein